ncbi:hypothetical protein GCK72_001710 [Caenorhabditis remanei]|uniref:Uncharacterized protein n=1 Tax=Caenorhabditis remanei TaxID=31234 RepID=A0A6A5HUH5_CAERE|nr:hypothetical protein GCK72_001710 [Caenorhabditis remanei]KAF1769893.1 hypothetical protein GCK72_001710 [Caenorhabditis remanei]
MGTEILREKNEIDKSQEIARFDSFGSIWKVDCKDFEELRQCSNILSQQNILFEHFDHWSQLFIPISIQTFDSLLHFFGPFLSDPFDEKIRERSGWKWSFPASTTSIDSRVLGFLFLAWKCDHIETISWIVASTNVTSQILEMGNSEILKFTLHDIAKRFDVEWTILLIGRVLTDG